MDFSVSDLRAQAKKFEWALLGIGFVYGVTLKDAAFNGPAYNLQWRAADFLSHFGIAGVKIGPYTTKQAFTFNMFGFLNKGFWAALFLEVARNVVPRDGRLGQIAHIVFEIAEPVAIGYSVGGIFDPPGSPGVSSSSQAVRGAGRGQGAFAGGSLLGSYY